MAKAGTVADADQAWLVLHESYCICRRASASCVVHAWPEGGTN